MFSVHVQALETVLSCLLLFFQFFFYRSRGEFFNFLFNSKSLQERNTEKVQKFSAHIFKYINYSSILASLTISDGKEVPSLMHSWNVSGRNKKDF